MVDPGKRAWYLSVPKKRADIVAELLEKDGICAKAIHSDKTQSQRIRTLENFKNNKFNILVATDVAARGLDIEQLPLVINYDLPKIPQDYIHRIGRTGRAGKKGRAISLVSPEEKKFLSDIQQLVKKTLEIEPLPYFENDSSYPNENKINRKNSAHNKITKRNKKTQK